MMTKKQNWKATADFEWDGKSYMEGDTFRKPSDWKYDKEYTVLNGGSPVFVYPVFYGYEVVDNIRQKVVEERRVILPVE